MNKQKNHINCIKTTVFGFLFLLIFSGCSVYRYGYLKTTDNNSDLLVPDLDSLVQEKEILFSESETLVSKFDSLNPGKEPIPPLLLNQLFENLQKHNCIDHTFHHVLNSEQPDSVLEIVVENLVFSATKYHQLFQENRYLRRTVNRGNISFQVDKKNLLRSQKFLWAKVNREKLISEIPLKEQRGSKCKFLSRKFSDQCTDIIYDVSSIVSEGIGRLVAAIHKKPEPEKNVPRLMPHLQKFDIVVQKSPLRLTDKFIAGYFGHAAIYLGDSVFAEGLHNGIVESDPFKFAEGGKFLVIRLKNLTVDKQYRIENLVRNQIGKKYDYHYNANSPDRLFCTELIYYTFDEVEWQTRTKPYGIMIFPDHLVRTALSSDEFCFPLYLDEEQVIETPSIEFIENLLKQ